MTTIAILGDKLYADRRVLVHGRPLVFTEGSKIVVSENKQMAYAISGDILRPDQLPEFERILQTGLSAALTETPFSEKLKAELRKANIARHLMILTRDHAACVTPRSLASLDQDGSGFFTFLPREVLVALGTGSDYLFGAWKVTQSIEQAFIATAALDNYSSAHYDTAWGGDLEPFEVWETAEVIDE